MRRIAAFGLLVVLPILLAGAARADTVDGVDVAAIVTALADDQVAVIDRPGTTESSFAPVISRARGGNLALSIVVLGADVTSGAPATLAGAIRTEVGGTVLLITPTRLVLSSDTLGDSVTRDAEAAAAGVTDPVTAAGLVVDSLIAEPFPWSLVLFGGVAVLVVGRVAGGFWEGKRHRRSEPDDIEDLRRGLAERLRDLRPAVRDLIGRTASTQRHDIQDRAHELQARQDDLESRLSPPLDSRRELNSCAHLIHELTDAVRSLQVTVDALPEPDLPPPDDRI